MGTNPVEPLVTKTLIGKFVVAVGFGYGLLLVVLDANRLSSSLAIQYVAATVPAFTSSIAMGIVLRELTRPWLWISIFGCAVLHIGVIAHYLPVPNVLAAILVGVAEAFIFALIAGVIRDSMNDGNSRSAL